MLPDRLKKVLKFCYAIHPNRPGFSALDQAKAALRAGATLLHYPADSFSPAGFEALSDIRNLCSSNSVPLLIDDDPVLAKAVNADGARVKATKVNVGGARAILGENAIICGTVTTADLPEKTILDCLDYIEFTPGAPARLITEDIDAGLRVLQSLSQNSPKPIVSAMRVAWGHTGNCLKTGAKGMAVSGKNLPSASAEAALKAIGAALKCPPRLELVQAWHDEFGLITRLVGREMTADRSHPAIRIPAGDDACLLRPLDNPVITTDTQREGIHFRFDWQTPEEIGQKAVTVTLSDLAASYAKPISLFINLCLPPGIGEETVAAVYRGIRAALAGYGCAMGGGNTSRGQRFALDLFAVGEGRKDIFPTRGSARPGDGLYTTGPLGLARAGLEALQRKDSGFPALTRRFKAPAARFDAAAVLAEHGVRCVMDLSDGLAGDARHIASASGVSIEIDLKGDRPEKELTAFCRKYGKEASTMALAGGEDYELLFACRPKIFNRISRMLPGAFQVGRCVDDQGQPLLGEAAGINSFQHG